MVNSMYLAPLDENKDPELTDVTNRIQKLQARQTSFWSWLFNDQDEINFLTELKNTVINNNLHRDIFVQLEFQEPKHPAFKTFWSFTISTAEKLSYRLYDKFAQTQLEALSTASDINSLQYKNSMKLVTDNFAHRVIREKFSKDKDRILAYKNYKENTEKHISHIGGIVNQIKNWSHANDILNSIHTQVKKEAQELPGSFSKFFTRILASMQTMHRNENIIHKKDSKALKGFYSDKLHSFAFDESPHHFFPADPANIKKFEEDFRLILLYIKEDSSSNRFISLKKDVTYESQHYRITPKFNVTYEKGSDHLIVNGMSPGKGNEFVYIQRLDNNFPVNLALDANAQADKCNPAPQPGISIKASNSSQHTASPQSFRDNRVPN